jgi:hypothetical protein
MIVELLADLSSSAGESLKVFFPKSSRKKVMMPSPASPSSNRIVRPCFNPKYLLTRKNSPPILQPFEINVIKEMKKA